MDCFDISGERTDNDTNLRNLHDPCLARYRYCVTWCRNRTMERYIKRFQDRFCFQLSRDEYRQIPGCQNGTLDLEQGKYSKNTFRLQRTGSGNAHFCPSYGSRQASRLWMPLCWSHCLFPNAQLLPYQEIQRIENREVKPEVRDEGIEGKMVTKEDLSALMMLFAQGITSDEVLILEGQPFDADVACQQIYGRTKKIILVSNPGTVGDTADTVRLSCGGTDVPKRAV